MPAVFANPGQLDRWAIRLSGLCAVHCVATAVMLALIASAGGLLGQPIIHEVGLSLAMVLGAIAFVRGVREHGFLLPCMVGFAGLVRWEMNGRTGWGEVHDGRTVAGTIARKRAT